MHEICTVSFNLSRLLLVFNHLNYFISFYLYSFTYFTAFSAPCCNAFLYPLNLSVGLRGGRSSGERWGTPWTGRQSITGPHRDEQPCTLALRTILESPINLTCMFLDGGRKTEYPERTHAYTGRTCRLPTERPQVGIEPGTLSL